MYLGLMQLQFDEMEAISTDLKFLSSLCQKIQKRFKAQAKMHQNYGVKTGQVLAINIVQLNSREQELTSCFDSIAKYCEQEGVGRIALEKILIEPVESLLTESH